MMIAIPTEVHDKDGNLTVIEFHDDSGKHILDAVWDVHDPQDTEHRIKFRNWAYNFLEGKGYDVQL
jgi:hypothetical protein